MDCLFSKTKMCPNDTVPDVRMPTFTEQHTENFCRGWLRSSEAQKLRLTFHSVGCHQQEMISRSSES